jgi:hypothetical protein
MVSIVPMQAIPNHSFSCVIPLNNGNIELRFTMQYNEVAGFWFVDIGKDNQTIISGYPMIPAQDLLEQFQYMGIGHAYLIPRSELSKQFPDYETLSTEWYVVWSD